MGFVLERISFSYPAKNVFKDFSLNLEAGRFIGIIGPNGCGKTTLLDLIMRLHRPHKGHITYLGKSLAGYSKRELARHIALVPQNYGVNFPYSAKEVVMMGRYPHIPRFSTPSSQDQSKVKKIMVQTGCMDLAQRPITALSGGERQRVVFARALAQEPKVLVLDEATANMDIHHSLHLLHLIAKMKRESGLGVIAVFQDINLAAMFCQDLVVISEGRVAAVGPTAAVLQPEILLKVFQVQAKVYFEDYSQSQQVVFRQ